MQFDFSKIDYSTERPKLVLKTMNGDSIGVISELYDMQLSPSYNEISELTFTVPAFSHGRPTPFYQMVTGMRIVELPEIGRFILQNPKIVNNGIREIKECTAYSLEYETTYKNLILAAGTYNLWNPAAPSGTIIGMLMEDNPLWSCPPVEVQVDADLIGRYRTFEVSDNWYNFLKNTAQEAYQCIFDFDTFRRRLIVRSAKTVAKPSEIFISLDNLAKEIDVTENTDELFTCLDVNGADSVDIRSVNPSGTNKIYNLDHFMTTEHFSPDVIDRWHKWKSAIEAAQLPFYTLTIQAAVLDLQIKRAEAEKMLLESNYKSFENLYSVAFQAEQNNITPSTSSAEYKRKMAEAEAQKAAKQAEIARLTEEHDRIQRSLDEMSNGLTLKEAFTIRDENGDVISTEPWTLISGYIRESVVSESSFVVSEYDLTSALSHMDNLNAATVTVTGGTVTEVEVPTHDRQTFSIHGGSIFLPGTDDITNVIQATCDIREDKTVVLSAYLEGVRIDGKYFPNSNLTITCSIGGFRTSDSELSFSDMTGTLYITNVATEFQQQSVKWDLYEYGMELLEKSAHPNYTFEVDCANFLADEDFLRFKNKLQLGQRIYLRIGDETVLTPVVIGAEINLHDPTDFSITFANSYNEKSGAQSVQDLLAKSVSMGSTLDSNKLSYSAYKNTHADNAVENLIHDALDLAQKSIMSSSGQGLCIDDSGIKLRKRKEGTSPEDNLFEGSQVWMTNNNMLFVDANGNARLAIGEIGGNFGIIADVIYGQLIAGVNVVISNNKPDGTAGTFTIDGNGIVATNNSFKLLFDKNGKSEELSVQEYVLKNGSSVHKDALPPDEPHDGTLWFQTTDQKWYRFSDPDDDGDGTWEALTDGELSAIVKTENGSTTVKLDSVRGAIDTTVSGMAGTAGNLLIDESGLWLVDSDSPATASKAVWMNGSGISLSNTRSAHDSNDPSYNSGTNSSFQWTTAISSDGVFADKFVGNKIFGNIALGIGTPKSPGDIETCPFYVDANGKLHATGAEISGIVDAEGFKINGNNALTSTGKISAYYLYLKGLSILNSAGKTTFKIDSNGNVTINGGTISFSALDNLENNVSSLSSSLSDKMDKNPSTETNIGSNWVYTGTLEADQIETGQLDADHLKLYGQMTVHKTKNGEAAGGYIGYMEGSELSPDGSGFKPTKGIGIMQSFNTGLLHCTEAGVRIGYGTETTIACVGAHCYSSHPMEIFSDRRLKNSVDYDIVNRYEGFYRSLKPCRFKMNSAPEEAYHTGFIAQDVKHSLENSGLTAQDLFALTQWDHKNDKDGMYAIRYSELIALNTAMVQQTIKRLDELENRLNSDD